MSRTGVEEQGDDAVWRPSQYEDVTDYATEQIEEESEGHLLRVEKAHIRGTMLLQDSALLTWGDGKDGKLGHHTEESLHVPYMIAALQQIPIMSAALGKNHSLFLTEEGMVLACGNGQFGQLGLGAMEDARLTPVLIQGLNSITQVAAGDFHSMALNKEGILHAWGCGSWGKLGQSYDGNVSAPRVVSTLTSSQVQSVACGGHHTACITVTGDVWTWGKGYRGQLGHKTVQEEYSPRLVSLLRRQGASKIVCGDDHTLVKCLNGRVFVFGANKYGQLGLGDLVDRQIPIDIDSQGHNLFTNDPVADVAAKGNMSMILTNTGRVYMFGDGEDEQRQHFRRPTHIHVIPKGEFISSVACLHDRAYALSDAGRLYRWSSRDVNLDPDNAAMLEPLHAIAGVIRVYCGYNHLAVICTTSHGLTAAMLTRQRLGSLSLDISQSNVSKIPDEPALVPVKVMPDFLEDFDESTTSEAPSRAGDGYVFSYGKGLDGRLGHGLEYTMSEASKLRPCRVEKLSKMSVGKVGCGKDTTWALTDTGTLYTWGNAQFGKLGLNQSSGCQAAPMPVTTLSKFRVVLCAMGRNHALALTDKKTVFAWGSNTFGQLGLEGVTSAVAYPVEVNSLRDVGVRHIACGGFHSLLCTWTHDLYSCGKGWHGQLGQGDYESLTAQSKTLSYFKKIQDGLGAGHNCIRVFGGTEASGALTEEGALFTWGQGSQSQLGHYILNNESRPRRVERLAKCIMVDLAMGKSHCIALSSDGLPWAWGKGNNGQLGISERGDKERVPRVVELCRRTVSRVGSASEQAEDIPWGSVYFKRDKDEKGSDVDVRVVENNGKVIQVAASNNFSCMIMERPANEEEIREYRTAVQTKRGGLKKVTEHSVVRELFVCGSGKGGVMQNQGKENEYLPRHMPVVEGSSDKLDSVVQVAAGRHHVVALCFEDMLINVEANNKEQADAHDVVACKLRELDALEKEIANFEEAPEEEEDQIDENMNPFDMDRRSLLDNFIQKVENMAPVSKEQTKKCLFDNNIDLETLSTLRTENDGDEMLKELGITAIGARRRLLKAIEGMPRKWKPSFYAYQTADSLFISWPDSIATEENRKRELARKAKADHAAADNPFIRLHRKKCGDRIFKALTRFAEMAHYELISERANLRYQGDGDGSYKCYTWGVGMHGRLGHGYGVAYATPQMLPHHEGTRIQIMRVSCGAQHSIACTYDGSVLTWGNGQYGQLGDGQHPEDYQGVGFNIAYSPKPVSHLKRYFIIGVAAGRWHNLALVNDRSIWVWGDNKFGQLGLDHFEPQGLPRKLFSLDSRMACSLHCGSWHSAVVTESGKMFLWGKNAFGQLGDGSVRTRNHPVLNQTLREIGKVRTCALGGDHTLVVMVGNLVYSFGRGDKGQLGLPKIDDYHPTLLRDSSTEGPAGSYKIQAVPAEIVDLTNSNVCQVAAGDQHSLALSVFGEIWSFGASDFGQLGHGNIVDMRLPTPILPQRHNIPANIRNICAGYTFSLAATDTGEVYSWGQGESGELGHASKILMYAPTEIPELRDVCHIAAGHRHAAAVSFTSNLAHISASQNSSGGGGARDDVASKAGGAGKSRASKSLTTGASSRGGSSRAGTSVASSDNTSVTGSRLGSRSNRSGTRRSGTHVSAVRSRLQAYALVWGEDTCGQLGMRGLQGARSPTLLRDMAVGATSVIAADASSDSSAFVTDTGQLFMCGGGSRGRLGLGHTNSARSPMQVHSLSQHVVVDVACGLLHTVCLTDNGRVFAWGDGTWGNTGTVTEADVLQPVEIRNLAARNIAQVVCGHFHSFARSVEGSAFAWGKNANGQLGIGTVSVCEVSPIKILINSQVQHVSAGGNHSCAVALMSPPNLFTFGMNANGQLGHDDQVDRCEPMPVNLLEDRLVVSASCGLAHTVAVSKYGDVLVWGNGRSGQLGLYEGTDQDLCLPVQLPPFCHDHVVKVVCGDEITLAVTEEQRVFLWGLESTMGLGATHAHDAANPSGPKEVEGLTYVDSVAAGATHVIAIVSHVTAADYEDETGELGN